MIGGHVEVRSRQIGERDDEWRGVRYQLGDRQQYRFKDRERLGNRWNNSGHCIRHGRIHNLCDRSGNCFDDAGWHHLVDYRNRGDSSVHRPRE